MRLLLTRRWFTERSTIGEITIDGAHECWSLEDVVRAPGMIVRGETAIPSGLYSIAIDWSPRFRAEVPRLVGVDGFEGIRIHPGNTAEDTAGCILVGRVREADRILESRDAYVALNAKLRASMSPNLIEIIEAPEAPLMCREGVKP